MEAIKLAMAADTFLGSAFMRRLLPLREGGTRPITLCTKVREKARRKRQQDEKSKEETEVHDGILIC